MTTQSGLYHADQKHRIRNKRNLCFSNQHRCDTMSFPFVNTTDFTHLFTWMLLKPCFPGRWTKLQRCTKCSLYEPRRGMSNTTDYLRLAEGDTQLRANPQARASLETPTVSCWELQMLSSCPAPKHTLWAQSKHHCLCFRCQNNSHGRRLEVL